MLEWVEKEEDLAARRGEGAKAAGDEVDSTRVGGVRFKNAGNSRLAGPP